jgi:AbiV family abortive infection protein
LASFDTPRMTAELLRSYSDAALSNAEELLVEASLLHENGHYPRTYFLAVASIEESGKGLLTFDAQSRNLTDQAVCAKLKASVESHDIKISYALSMWAFDMPNRYEAFQKALDLIIHLQRGREPSMYSDLRSDPDRAQTPRDVVRPVAARDCLRLAAECLAYSQRHIKEKTPQNFTNAHDRLFTMKSRKFHEMLNNVDFWWYYIARMEAGHQDMADAVLGYERDHIKTDTLFRP